MATYETSPTSTQTGAEHFRASEVLHKLGGFLVHSWKQMEYETPAMRLEPRNNDPVELGLAS